jgi:hypothetical protein
MCKSVDNFKGTAKVTSTSQRGNLKGSKHTCPITKSKGKRELHPKSKGNNYTLLTKSNER